MNAKFFLKIAITLALLMLVFRLIDGERFWQTLLSVPAWCALATIGGYIIGQILSAYKWWLIAKSGGVSAGFRRALKSYFVGMFVNFFGLGIVGGDVARGALLSSGEKSRTASFASVLADRLHGLAVLALIGTAATAIFGFSSFAQSSEAGASLDHYLVYLLYIIGGGILLGWFLGPTVLLKLVPGDGKLREKAEMLAAVFPKNVVTMAHISLVSVLFHLLQISLHWIIAQGFGVELPLVLLFVTIPFVNILSSLPISWNGLGVRENAYVFFLSPLYLSQEQAVAMGAVWFVAVTTSSILGGIVAFITGDFSILRNLTGKTSPAAQLNSKPTPGPKEDNPLQANMG